MDFKILPMELRYFLSPLQQMKPSQQNVMRNFTVTADPGSTEQNRQNRWTGLFRVRPFVDFNFLPTGHIDIFLSIYIFCFLFIFLVKKVFK
jgi:hypothetical protein